MNFLYILSEYLPDSGGGIISHYARILPELAARGHGVTVVLASKDKLDHPAYEIDGVRVRPLKSKFLEQYSNRFGRWAGLDIFYYLLPVAWAAWAQAQEEGDYDLVEATDWALLFLPWVAEKKRAPVVVSLHGSCGQVDWFGKGEPRSLDGDLVRMVEAAALRGADVVHANSRANAEFWGEKTGIEIQVIPPARSALKDGVTTKETKGHEREEEFLTTIERQGGRETRKLGKAEGRATESWPQMGAASGTMQVNEQPKVGPKGEGVGTTESNDTDRHNQAPGQVCGRLPEGSPEGETIDHREKDCRRQPEGCSAAKSTGERANQMKENRRAAPGEPGLALNSQNPFTSELAWDCENSSLARSASGPVGALIAPEDRISQIGDRGIGSDGGNQLADSMEFLEGHSQAGLQMDNQKGITIRTANDLSASGKYSSSVPIREIRGFPSAPLDAPGLVIGRLQNWKGAEVLCQALRLAPKIEIEWVGGDTDWGTSGMKASEYLAANYPDVFGNRLRWLGRLNRVEVSEKINAAGFLVVPSLWDVFNLTAAEGMEAGVPVLCSKAAGAEMLIEHGRSGFLFDPEKPEELAECLKLVFKMDINAKNEIGLFAREAVKATLLEGKILGLLEKSYANVLGQQNPNGSGSWIASLVSPGSVVEPDCQPPFAKRAIRKLGRFLAQV